jgi:hypothetical protein
MICENCAWQNQCEEKKKSRHRKQCEDYFPDLKHAKPQQMGRFATLESRLQQRRNAK